VSRTEIPIVPVARVAAVVVSGGRLEPSIVVAHGEYDLSNSADLLACLERAISSNDAAVILDLSAVTFMDASTLGVIARANGLLEDESRTLVLRGPSSLARRIVHLCGLSHVLEPVDAAGPALRWGDPDR
jgi:anti-sigma B factor antagonist